MQRSKFDDDFNNFPYPADFSDGRTNKGGIDLTLEPDRIDEISEAADFPELRDFIVDLNKPQSLFMTLGCEAGQTGDLFEGYVEFTFKDEKLANDETIISHLDVAFFENLHEKHPEIEALARLCVHWEYSPFLYHETSARLKIAFFYRQDTQDDAGRILDLIRHFLLNVYSLG